MASKQKILIVDDDTNISELIALYLTKECFETMCVEDGEAALKACVSFKPDLILLDLMLPGMDGYQVCREVRKTSSTPIIMLSDIPEVNIISYPDLEINMNNYSVNYMGKKVDMPPKEIELLHFLAASPNQVFTREQLLDHIWGYEYAGDTRTVDVHIKRIREKIKDNKAWSLSTVWGIGYKFELKK